MNPKILEFLQSEDLEVNAIGAQLIIELGEDRLQWVNYTRGALETITTKCHILVWDILEEGEDWYWKACHIEGRVWKEEGSRKDHPL